jgi:hypothetical protein
MSWARVDDGWWCQHSSLSLAARGLWITTAAWSCQQRTDTLTRSVVAFLTAHQPVDALARELVGCGLWSATDGGWVIVGWHRLYGVGGRPHVPDVVRLELWLRDGWSCRNCDARCGDLQVDHIIPLSRGGSEDLDNFQWLCGWCNRAKADLLPDEWEPLRAAAAAQSPCAPESVACHAGLLLSAEWADCGHDPDPLQRRVAEVNG